MTILDESEYDEQMEAFSETCMYCKHLNEDIIKRSCKAFPKGIPSEIWMGENNHRKSFPGDHGIQFESATPKQDETAKFIRDKLQKFERG